MGDYKDCNQWIKDIECEEIIFASTQIIKSAINNLNSEMFKEGIKKLNTISYYKNVPNLIKQYERQFASKKYTLYKEKKTKKIMLIS